MRAVASFGSARASHAHPRRAWSISSVTSSRVAASASGAVVTPRQRCRKALPVVSVRHAIAVTCSVARSSGPAPS